MQLALNFRQNFLKPHVKVVIYETIDEVRYAVREKSFLSKYDQYELFGVYYNLDKSKVLIHGQQPYLFFELGNSKPVVPIEGVTNLGHSAVHTYLVIERNIIKNALASLREKKSANWTLYIYYFAAIVGGVVGGIILGQALFPPHTVIVSAAPHVTSG